MAAQVTSAKRVPMILQRSRMKYPQKWCIISLSFMKPLVQDTGCLTIKTHVQKGGMQTLR